jgi:electron transfer flavoprotein beta subunit
MAQTPIRIAVLVSTGRHPVSGAPRWSRNDARALDMARRIAASPADIDVVYAGHERPEALNDYLALGVKTIQVLDIAPGDDIVAALAGHVQGSDIILCGMRAEGQHDSGMLPYMLAQRLDAALLPAALELTCAGGTATVTQFLPKGRRRRVQAGLPCVVTVHPLAPLNLKYAHAHKLAGRIAVVPGQAQPCDPSPWTTFPVEARPVRLAAREKRSGHARMLSATTTESRAGMVMDQGSAQEKATAVISYLRKHGLIDY